MRSSEIRKSLHIEPLLLRIERCQLRWFDHVSRMPRERLPKQALLAKANRRRPVGRPRTRWTDYIEDLGWNRLRLHPSEMMEVMEDREVWWLNLKLLPRNPQGKASNEERKEEEGNVYLLVVDYCRFPEMMLLKSFSSNAVITHLKTIFSLFSIPRIFRSDTRPQYCSHEFKRFSDEWGFNHNTISPTFL